MRQQSSTVAGYLLTFIVVGAFAVYPSVAPVALVAGCSPFGFVLATMLVALAGTLTLGNQGKTSLTQVFARNGAHAPFI